MFSPLSPSRSTDQAQAFIHSRWAPCRLNFIPGPLLPLPLKNVCMHMPWSEDNLWDSLFSFHLPDAWDPGLMIHVSAEPFLLPTPPLPNGHYLLFSVLVFCLFVCFVCLTSAPFSQLPCSLRCPVLGQNPGGRPCVEPDLRQAPSGSLSGNEKLHVSVYLYELLFSPCS